MHALDLKILSSRQKEQSNSRARHLIGRKVRELRKRRHWTQADLSANLGISQGYLSELERGRASFTAEQFLELLKLFNVPATEFAPLVAAENVAQLQNALARLGATHLRESDDLVPSDRHLDAVVAVRDALAEGDARLVTAVAPVLVKHADEINLRRLALDLSSAGLERRLWWAVESTIGAIQANLAERPSRSAARVFRRALVVLEAYLDSVPRTQPSSGPDILDPTVRSKRSVAHLVASSSAVAKRWGIVTSIQTDDFTSALRAAHDD